MMTARTTISSSLGVGWFLGLGFVVILVIGTLVAGGFFTDHTRTVPVRDSKHEKGGYYLVSDGKGQVIKLKRRWWDWNKNMEFLLLETRHAALADKTVTFHCWGIRAEIVQWYSNCDSVVAGPTK
jgi:hypothetical protein